LTATTQIQHLCRHLFEMRSKKPTHPDAGVTTG